MADGNRGRPEGGAGAVTWRGRKKKKKKKKKEGTDGVGPIIYIRPGLGLHGLLNFLRKASRTRLSSSPSLLQTCQRQIRLRNDLSGSHLLPSVY